MRRGVHGVFAAVLIALVLNGCERTDDMEPDGVTRDLDGQALDADDGEDADDLDADDDADDGKDAENLDADDADDGKDADELDADDDADDGEDADDLDADDDADDGEDGPREWAVETSGLSFVPEELTIRAGDTVEFDLGDDHDAVEVDEATWNAGGSTPKVGGFSVGLGQKVEIPFPVAGTYYYVCTPHVDFGMKGTIIVTP
jgi:plastocyanin